MTLPATYWLSTAWGSQAAIQQAQDRDLYFPIQNYILVPSPGQAAREEHGVILNEEELCLSANQAA
jgi:hypothetical protein